MFGGTDTPMKLDWIVTIGVLVVGLLTAASAINYYSCQFGSSAELKMSQDWVLASKNKVAEARGPPYYTRILEGKLSNPSMTKAIIMGL